MKTKSDRMPLNTEADAWAYLDKLAAENAARDAKVKVTKAQIEEQARFLAGWAKRKPIVATGDGSYYRSGKWMTKLVPALVKGLLEAGFVTGTQQSFTVNHDAVKALKGK